MKSNTTVKYLYFHGFAAIEAGDTICAYIFRGKGIHEEDFEPFDVSRFSFNEEETRNPSFYIDRDFQEREETGKIEKLRRGKVVATYQID